MSDQDVYRVYVREQNKLLLYGLITFFKYLNPPSWRYQDLKAHILTCIQLATASVKLRAYDRTRNIVESK